MSIQLQTERMLLRRFQPEDLPRFVVYRNDPDVVSFNAWETITEARARAWFDAQRALEPGVPGQWLQLALELKATGEFIGDCGLQVQLQDARQAQTTISVAREHQGQGLATEAANALLDYAFINLDLHRVVVVIDGQNTRAAALVERVGLRREGHFLKSAWFKGHWADEYFYAILQSEWLPRRGLSFVTQSSVELPNDR